ncbi:MAG: hypothetical protein ACJ77K_01005 [Bacteroidia bacterium]
MWPKCLSGVITLLLVTLSCSLHAQDSYAYREGSVKHRLSAGVVRSYYLNHPDMTNGTKGEFGYTASYKAEIFIRGKANIMIGVDYMNEGCTFHGYYKKPGFTYLFDETYPYTHEFRIQEADLPLSIKLAFNKEKERPCSPYMIGGIGARYILDSYTTIINDSTGVTVYDAKDNIDFENTHTKGLSAFYQLGFGLQYNYRNNAHAMFIEFNYKYGLSRLHYDGDNGSNDLNIKDGHLSIVVGIRL